VANAEGRWLVKVKAGDPGGPFPLLLEGHQRLHIDRVWVGDVWLVSGQSNAAQAAEFSPTINEQAVHFFLATNSTPQDGDQRWSTRGKISMLAWHLGYELYSRLHVPIGIIVCAVGGTSVEQWKPGPDPDAQKAGPGGGLGEAGGLYERWIRPLQPYRIKGVAWWQGESNSNNYTTYFEKFCSLVNIWRRDWGQSDLPFIWVQLQRINRQGPEYWITIGDARAAIADAQRRALSLPHTGMAVTYDVSEGDLHPSLAEKKIIADRIAISAAALAYGSRAEGSGPLPMKAVRRGKNIVIRFRHGKGLHTRENVTIQSQVLCGFQVRAAEGLFIPAAAQLSGENVLIPIANKKGPFRVRYAWGPMPAANLYNEAGLPAATFEMGVEE
jgi:sialate O-acetylesterase